jgi:hypothetical protein
MENWGTIIESGMGMKKAVVGIALACGLGFAQTQVSKLNGKKVYVLREWVDGGHQNGFQALKDLVEANAKTYGYTAEVPANPLNQNDLNAVFARLYKGDGTKPANAIDVMVFSQGEGDWNVTGNPLIGGAETRMTQINAHVRGGGGLIITHAAAGREISRSGWIFGAKLMGDWFQDEYFASAAVQGNQGHFGSGTAGTTTLDEETLPAKDSSTFFIRNVMTLGKDKKGMGMPLVTDQVTGEWYHFNGGFKFEDGTGGTVSNTRNQFKPVQVRGQVGYPDLQRSSRYSPRSKAPITPLREKAAFQSGPARSARASSTKTPPRPMAASFISIPAMPATSSPRPTVGWEACGCPPYGGWSRMTAVAPTP